MLRNKSIDVLKLIMAIFVVGLHGRFLNDIYPSVSYFLNQGLFRLGVPVFLIISGFYFYEVNDSKQFYKWIKRLSFLYVIWMSIYSPFWFSTKITDDIKYLVLGYVHLWYLVSALIAFILVWFTRKYPAIQFIY